MKRVKLAKALLAALLVVMLPLEQAHCACVAMAQRAAQPMAAGAGSACHASCCAMHGAAHGAVAAPNAPHAPAPRGCPCEKLTATDLPQVLAVAHADVPAPTFVLLATPDPVAPRAEAVTAVPALDAGVPPPLIDPGAHGLRAPPLSS